MTFKGTYFPLKTELLIHFSFGRNFRFSPSVVRSSSGPAASTILKSVQTWSLSVSISSQHGVKLSNFSWAVWRKIIYRFLLLRHCILLSWKSLILIIYQNKINPKQILNIRLPLVGCEQLPWPRCRDSWQCLPVCRHMSHVSLQSGLYLLSG